MMIIVICAFIHVCSNDIYTYMHTTGNLAMIISLSTYFQCLDNDNEYVN